MQQTTLNALPDGATDIPVGYWLRLTLVGATVAGGRIESATPFTVQFNRTMQAFGADFVAPGGTPSLSFFQGPTLIGTITRQGSEFLGAVVWGSAALPTRVDVGAAGAPTFQVDNLVGAVPEPSTVALVATGLATLGALARRRRAA